MTALLGGFTVHANDILQWGVTSWVQGYAIITEFGGHNLVYNHWIPSTMWMTFLSSISGHFSFAITLAASRDHLFLPLHVCSPRISYICISRLPLSTLLMQFFFLYAAVSECSLEIYSMKLWGGMRTTPLAKFWTYLTLCLRMCCILAFIWFTVIVL